ncbi:MAG TPA: class II fructose-bisphosphate aldolase [Intrasporangium sp.]|uniref:class II fructose-bisphosphate aldolase n=1 Tax=Intrasporangium sp. TaxID=1925024 RepID=UPI002B46195D|nr:class II fructose-bisphosphate aldolase [Intrasporangium sp.]HKX66602.1 class II fructose-bisphosphate aldolase [Intrasporangium sp.]
MQTRLDAIVHSALDRGRAAGAFTCYDLATAYGVVQAATEAGQGVILLVAPSTAARPYGPHLVRALRALADTAPVPVSVQLDHADDLDLVLRTVRAGADAVLVDGSKQGYEGNVELLLRARELLARHDVVLEAELGRIEGNEDVARLIASGGGELTDPGQAADFVERTGVDLLAVSIGNVHGSYLGEPLIDHGRLDAIRAAVEVPLVLHGASGLPVETVRRCISSGVGKINVNTELRRAVLEHLIDQAPVALHRGADLESLLGSWSDVVRHQVLSLIEGFTAG